MAMMTYKGACLCGSVRYEITGEAVRFYHCHCQRCRKATGTGHASNLFIKADGIDWLAGEEYLASYKLPEAERFSNQFCRQCGSRMPRYVPELKSAILPAGSLDNEPDLAPQARIFWDSRAQWSCGSEELPVFAEYVTDKPTTK